jgi:murein DD-endopeptidase MepM/ murein hydrolase activator NlpD
MRPPLPSSRFKNLGVVTTPFGGQTAFEGSHPGLDIANRIGTKIPSPVEGFVVEATAGQPQGQGFGNKVVVKDKAGNMHQFGHLNKPYVAKGTYINKNQPIGEMGNSGAAYSKSGMGDGSHLDYRIVNAFGKYMNPGQFLTSN